MRNQEKSKSKGLRQKLLMIYHDDGILDIAVGVTILMLSAVMATEGVVFIGLIGIPIVLYIPIKENVSIPRIGMIRFEAEEVTRKKLFGFLYLGIGAFLTFVILALVRINPSSGIIEMIGNNEIIIFASLLSGTLYVAGRILNNARFSIYALLSLGLVLGLYFIGQRVWPAVAFVGIFMEALGIYKLMGFLREYPLEAGE